MRINEVSFETGPPIDGYGPGFFRVGGVVHHGPLALLPQGRQAWGGLPDLTAFLEHRARFDVLLMGMGAQIAGLPADLRNGLEAAGIGVEIMATPAACRTYNVLLGEGRRIAAALTPV